MNQISLRTGTWLVSTKRTWQPGEFPFVTKNVIFQKFKTIFITSNCFDKLDGITINIHYTIVRERRNLNA